MSDQTKEIEDKLRSAIEWVLSRGPNMNRQPYSGDDLLTQWQQRCLWFGKRFIYPLVCSLALASFSCGLLEGDEKSQTLEGEINGTYMILGILFIVNSVILAATLYSFAFFNERVAMLSKLPCPPEDILKSARLGWLEVVVLLLISNVVWMPVFDFADSRLSSVGYAEWLLAALLLTLNTASTALLGALVHNWIKRWRPVLLPGFWTLILLLLAMLSLLAIHSKFGLPDTTWRNLHHKFAEAAPSTWAIVALTEGSAARVSFALSCSLIFAGAVIWWRWPSLTRWRLLEYPASKRSQGEAKEGNEKTQGTYQKHELVQKLKSTCRVDYAFVGRLEKLIAMFLHPLERVIYPVHARGRLMWSGNWLLTFFLTVIGLTIYWATVQSTAWLDELNIPTDIVFTITLIMVYAGYSCLLIWPESGLEKVDEKYKNRLHHRDLSAWTISIIKPWAWVVMKCKIMGLRLLFMLPLAFAFEAGRIWLQTQTGNYLKLVYFLSVFAISVLSCIPVSGGFHLKRLVKSIDSRRVTGVCLFLVHWVLICIYFVAGVYTLFVGLLKYTSLAIPYLSISILVMITSSLLMFQIQAWRIQSGQADWILTARKKIS